jgi:hypothetical protein
MLSPSSSSTTSRPSCVSPTERAVATFRRRLLAFNRDRLSWDQAEALAAAFGLQILSGPLNRDAVLVSRSGRPRIFVSAELHRPTWGVFCVIHELAHHLFHPGSRDYYLGSPGWLGKIESQANVLALLALWPRRSGPLYPSILKAEIADSVVTLLVGVPTPSRHGFGTFWTSRPVIIQRYNHR